MRPILIELHCFPSISYFACLAQCKTAILEAQENYNKRSFRNKFKLLSDKGPHTFSIPLKKGKHEQQPIRKTRISYDEHWPVKLERTLHTYYNGSPYFDFYIESITEILHAGHTSLWAFNFDILVHLLKLIKLPVNLASSCDFERSPSGLIDMRSMIKPSTKIEHPSYPQVFEDKTGFVPNLSILDVLFALGPETRQFLMTSTLSCTTGMHD